MTDTLVRRLFDAEAVGLRVLKPCQASEAALLPPGLLRIGAHDGEGPPPRDGIEPFDILLTTHAGPPRPWVCTPDLAAELAHLETVVERQPLAATVAAQVLRTTPGLAFEAALLLESFAYSTLLASPGFKAWLAAAPPMRPREDARPRVRLERADGVLHIVLDRPRGRNAMDAALRDALCEALDVARLDPEQAPVRLRGEGAVFSVGGDLAEFGQAEDMAAAHAIRVLRSPAQRLAGLAERATAVLHGPCVGAGVEIPLAAGRVVARPGTSFRLPEVGMGLIPGAGGTATLPRRIGRRRACWMVVSGRPVGAATALAWGLVDAVEP